MIRKTSKTQDYNQRPSSKETTYNGSRYPFGRQAYLVDLQKTEMSKATRKMGAGYVRNQKSHPYED